MLGGARFGNPQQYFVFRFEDSLRKYEPQPRKRVKLSHSHCRHCMKKHGSLSKQNRLDRLCATRKKYLLQSRQRISGCSRKKQAISQHSPAKSKTIVSDFICDNQIYNKQQQEQQVIRSALQQPSVDRQFSDSQQIIVKQQKIIINSSTATGAHILIIQTPIRQQINIDINQRQQQVHREIMMSQENKHRKIRDIDFHIGLVGQLHQQICKNYRKTQNTPNQSPSSSLQPQMQMEEQQLIYHNQISSQFNQSSKNQQSDSDSIYIDEFRINKIQQEKGYNCIQQEYAEPEQNSSSQARINKTDSNKIDKIDDILIASKLQNNDKKCRSITKNKRLKQFVMSERDEEISMNNEGRIKFIGKKGEFLLSARVLYKMCASYGSCPEQITIRLLKRHPYLENIDNINRQITSNIENIDSTREQPN